MPDGRYRGFDIAMAANHDGWQQGIARSNVLEEFEAVEGAILEPNIEDEERRLMAIDCRQSGFTIGHRAWRVALVRENAGQRLSDIGFVVDYENVTRQDFVPLPSFVSCYSAAASSVLAACGSCFGKMSEMRAPPFVPSSRIKRPRCSSMIFFTMARPNPVPFLLVVT